MIAYKGQHTIHKKGGQLYWRTENGSMEGINNGFAYFSSKNLSAENQQTRFTIRFGLDGTQVYEVNNQQVQVNSGQFFVMNEGTEYHLRALNNEDTTMLAFCFNEQFIADFIACKQKSNLSLLDSGGLFECTNSTFHFPEHSLVVDAGLKTCIEELMDEHICAPVDMVDEFELFSTILTTVMRRTKEVLSPFERQNVVKKSTQVELFKRLSIARDYIQAHYCEDVNLNEISRVACLSPYHFHRAFKHTFGITPKKFVTHLRIERAKWLLENGDRSVQMICHEIGFRDVSSFTRLFCSYTGHTPSVYRNLLSNKLIMTA
ncbi:AraC-like DNA-binding protein [Roseivirga pacifica]|uniref:AraC-type DNA-binding protein n=1 Tax=Roseivirga pacifica TaxID=1267423 RepID=A0A1I0RJZ6_9BACT|nr:AraC family transcriptional regulator [Roseivirga pacifica]RKQ49775.1 AraC-like DNA-binding protein [Roseivirga pacifica]SEW41259.1 AraC-type DNA-binding protein [Roseivirga pacifica]